MKIYNEKISLSSDLINKDYTFSLLADIHNTKYTSLRLWNKLIEEIRKIKPEIIFIPGDLIYTADDLLDETTKEKLKYLLYNLSNIAPVYISLGNHDFKDGKKLKFNNTITYFKSLENDNLYFLNNESIDFNKEIDIIGFSPRYEAYYPSHKQNWNKYFIEDLLKSNIKYNKNKYVILLTHSPLVIKDIADTIDDLLIKTKNENELKKLEEVKKILSHINIVLCGHMHDGLIPKYVRKIGLFKGDKGLMAIEGESLRNTFGKVRYCRGIHNVLNAKMVITKGVNKWCQPNLVFSTIGRLVAKDITTINLTKRKEE